MIYKLVIDVYSTFLKETDQPFYEVLKNVTIRVIAMSCYLLQLTFIKLLVRDKL
jgi:hypothetical protein